MVFGESVNRVCGMVTRVFAPPQRCSFIPGANLFEPRQGSASTPLHEQHQLQRAICPGSAPWLRPPSVTMTALAYPLAAVQSKIPGKSAARQGARSERSRGGAGYICHMPRSRPSPSRDACDACPARRSPAQCPRRGPPAAGPSRSAVSARDAASLILEMIEI